MSYQFDVAGVARLEAYFAQIGACLRDKRKRESFAMYAFGILGEGERKSAEPIAARACGDVGDIQHTHDKLLHFLARASWDDHAVRRVAARYALAAMSARGEAVTTWIIDDTGFLKQGNCSVGVQRQYTGSAGKIANCQVGVSLSVATRTEHVPLDFALYLPSSRFCFRRVNVACEDGIAPASHEPVWLMMEWPEGEDKPTKFSLTTLPRRLSEKQIVRVTKERWRTERVYEELKGELGLDHFEGRSYAGWHHHISVVLCCFAFVVAERVQHFPPSQGRQDSTDSLDLAA